MSVFFFSKKSMEKREVVGAHPSQPSRPSSIIHHPSWAPSQKYPIIVACFVQQDLVLWVDHHTNNNPTRLHKIKRIQQSFSFLIEMMNFMFVSLFVLQLVAVTDVYGFVVVTPSKSLHWTPTTPTITITETSYLHRRTRSSATFLHAKVPPAAEAGSNNSNTKIPIHLLAGFLGSGKTTTLKHILENVEGTKVGVIVNDVAAVNIDSKLVSRDHSNGSSSSAAGEDETSSTSTTVVELQNGCACCSLADELLESIETLLNLQKSNNNNNQLLFDCIVVELSGVADPMAIKNNWKNAIENQLNPKVTSATELGQVITVIDSCTFGCDYMTWDIVKDRTNWIDDPKTDCVANRQVVELLAEQVEAANVLVINKQDLATKDQFQISKSMVTSLNEKATIITTSYGNVRPSEIFQVTTIPPSSSSSSIDTEEESSSSSSSHSHSHDHDCTEPDCTDSSHSHNHDHHDCTEPDCTDSSHSHSHDHQASSSETKEVDACTDPDCTDESHSHSHSHDHSSATTTSCNDPDCTDESHSHNHNHDKDETTDVCNDPNCTEEGHDHSHSHNHAASKTSTDNLGISNFVYKATRPFHMDRLKELLFQWPVPIKNELDIGLLTNVRGKRDGKDNDDGDYNYDINQVEIDTNPFVGVLRSKGFCWFCPTSWDGILEDTWRHNTAMYWSHAGKHLGIQMAGPFWDSVSEQDRKDFFKDNLSEYNRIQNEDFVTDEFGDRRQEIVFIGVDINSTSITASLNDCLLTDDEMDVYRENISKLFVVV